MKLDKVLTYKILLQVEKNQTDQAKLIVIEGYDDIAVVSHLMAMVQDALMDGDKIKDETDTVIDVRVSNLTPKGKKMLADVKEKQQKLIEALQNPKYDWRTVESVSNETGLSQDVVLEIFETLDDQVLRSSVPDKQGHFLYTTRNHYYKTQSIFTRSLSAATGSIRR